MKKENLWILAYKELTEKLMKFDMQNWKSIKELRQEAKIKV